MHKFFISQYINRLTKDDVMTFASKNDIHLKPEELNLIFNHLKSNWETVLYGDPTPLFQQLKSSLSKDSYEKGMKLYQKYHELYKNYL